MKAKAKTPPAKRGTFSTDPDFHMHLVDKGERGTWEVWCVTPACAGPRRVEKTW